MTSWQSLICWRYVLLCVEQTLLETISFKPLKFSSSWNLAIWICMHFIASHVICMPMWKWKYSICRRTVHCCANNISEYNAYQLMKLKVTLYINIYIYIKQYFYSYCNVKQRTSDARCSWIPLALKQSCSRIPLKNAVSRRQKGINVVTYIDPFERFLSR